MPNSPSPEPALAPDNDVFLCGRPEALLGEWSELWKADPRATPFQAPAWLLPWARHYAPGRFRAVGVRAQGRLAALVPVFEWQSTVLLAGTGPSDLGDGLFRPGFEGAAASLIGALALAAGDDVDRIELRQLRPGSPLLSARAPDEWIDRQDEGETCPVLRLQDAESMGAVPKRWRSNWRYALRRVEREGGILDLVPPDEAPDAFAALEELHRRRWEGRGEPGVFADVMLRDCLRDAVPALADHGLLRLHRIRFGADTAAVLLALAAQGATYYYLSGFDPTLARLSPGTVLVGAAIATAAREGAHEFHFLRGREPYKYQWGAEDHPTRVRRLMRATRSAGVGRS